MFRDPRVAFILATALGIASPVAALEPSLATTQYARSVYRSPGALPSDNVSAITQTRDGYLWVGTVNGLARFDGLRSVVFDNRNTPEIANNWVKALVEDRTSRLWIATFGGGLLSRQDGRFQRWGAESGLAYDVVLSLHESRGGILRAGTGAGGVHRLQGTRFVREPGTETIASSSVRTLLEDRAGAFWIGTDDGLYRLQDGVLRRFTRADGMTDDVIMALAEDEGGLWIGTERGGLLRWSGGRFTALTTRDGLSYERVWSLAVDRDRNVWVGTDGGGLDRVTNGRLSSMSTRNGLVNDFVWAIHEDREGSVWVGTNGGGLMRLKNGRVVPLTAREGLPSDFVWSVLRTRDESLWVGTEDAGLARVKGGSVTLLTTAEGLPSNQVKALLERPDGSIWVGTNLGLSLVRDGRVVRGAASGVPAGRINDLAEDAEGTLWVASDRFPLTSVVLGRAQEVPGLGPLQRQALQSVLAARDGSIWFGTVAGLGRLGPKDSKGVRPLTVLTRENGLPSNRIGALFEDKDGGVWAATLSGLAHVREGRVSKLTVREGLIDDGLSMVFGGRDGSIWMGTSRSLFRVERSEIEDVFAGRKKSVTCQTFDAEDGLPSPEINGAGASAWEDPDGRMWFATRGGLASIDVPRLVSNPTPPAVYVEEVLADGRRLTGTGGLRLPPSTRRITFRYTALGLSAPARVATWHRLEGFDPDWSESTASRTAEYTNLPHGRSYRFHVTAMNEDGVRNEAGALVELEIDSHWYETAWFRGAALLLVLLTGPLFYKARVHRLDQQRTELQALVTARTAELEAANATLAELSLQDPLTGVANRRRLNQVLEEEWRRAVRQRAPLTLLFLDVDFFKAYNDRLGHVAGDECLARVARCVADAHRRAGELVARYGGEEFAVLVPGLSEEGAERAAEAVRQRVESLALPHPGSAVGPVVTISVGVGWVLPTAAGEPAQLVEAADRALYRAKNAGRNRVSTDEGAGAVESGSGSP